jgi:hypothetical protein
LGYGVGKEKAEEQILPAPASRQFYAAEAN